MQFTCETKPCGKWVINSWSSDGISWPAYNKDKKRTIERYAHAFGVFVFESGMWFGGRRHHLREWSNRCVDEVMLDAIEDETVIHL